jgi:hypothetical protein
MAALLLKPGENEKDRLVTAAFTDGQGAIIPTPRRILNPAHPAFSLFFSLFSSVFSSRDVEKKVGGGDHNPAAAFVEGVKEALGLRQKSLQMLQLPNKERELGQSVRRGKPKDVAAPRSTCPPRPDWMG